MKTAISSLILSLAFAASVNGFLFGKDDDMFDVWSDLRANIPGFNSMPRTEKDAIDAKWTFVNNCSPTNEFRGKRYTQDHDPTIAILYTNKGRLAGMQIRVPRNNSVPGEMGQAFIDDGDFSTMTAYFVDPETICTDKETKFPDMFVFQLGPYSKGNFVKPPMKQEDVAKDSYPWTEGRCFFLMGKHYWSRKPKITSCDDTDPFFVLYNGGKLNAFGFQLIGNYESKYFERPGMPEAEQTMISVPKCMYADTFKGRLRTMHVYLDWPYNNAC